MQDPTDVLSEVPHLQGTSSQITGEAAVVKTTRTGRIRFYNAGGGSGDRGEGFFFNIQS